MKKFVLLFMLLAASLNAQTKVQSAKIDQIDKVTFKADQPADVRLLFPDVDKKTEEFVKNHPEGLNLNKLGKSSFSFTVGSTYSWFAMDLTNSQFYQVPSTCRKVGDNCYIFVEDTAWNSKVTQTEVDAVENAFDKATPGNASKGIYQKDVESFGNPPNVDGDNKIIILILDIKDGYTPGHSYIVGYFQGYQEAPKATYSGSNEAEIYYLDCNPLNLRSSGGLQLGLATTAHEFQHMIHFNYHDGSTAKPRQTTFLNEGCSLLAEYLNGYSFREQSSFATDTPQSLFTWRSGDEALRDYSRAARFMLYNYEQFGAQFITNFVQSSYADIQGVDDALSRLTTPTTRRFADILPDWYIANIMDNRAVNSKWGYQLTGLTKPQINTYWNANVTAYTANVPKQGVQYITHRGSINLNSTFSNCNTINHRIKAIKYGSGNPVIEDVTLNSTYSIPSLSGTYSAVQYVVMNNSQSTDYSFQYGSTGTTPPAYEQNYSVNPAVGAFSWAAGDTVSVSFDAVYGGKLDSIKVQFSKTGTVTGGIWEFTGTTVPSPLGKKLVTDMQVNSVVITSAIAEWTKVDLRSNSMSTSKPFAVAFPVVTNAPRLLVSEYPSPNPYHSFTYLGSSTEASPTGWYVINKENAPTIMYVYQIKAYVSVGTLGTEKTIEILPSSYSLSQNYPNPFNPSTKIQFSLPEAAKVSVIVYDILGREIKTLLNTQYNAGTHVINWNGDDNAGRKVATGVYMYSISTSKFVQTKKMVLLK